jgi:hypothetical protein
VDDVVLVQVIHPAKQLVHKVAMMGIRQTLGRLNDPMKVRVQQLHYDVKLVVLLPHRQVFKGYNVVVNPKVPHQPNLPQDVLGILRVSCHGGDLLDRNLLLSDSIYGGGDNAVRTLADGLQLTVSPINLFEREFRGGGCGLEFEPGKYVGGMILQFLTLKTVPPALWVRSCPRFIDRSL